MCLCVHRHFITVINECSGNEQYLSTMDHPDGLASSQPWIGERICLRELEYVYCGYTNITYDCNGHSYIW